MKYVQKSGIISYSDAMDTALGKLAFVRTDGTKGHSTLPRPGAIGGEMVLFISPTGTLSRCMFESFDPERSR